MSKIVATTVVVASRDGIKSFRQLLRQKLGISRRLSGVMVSELLEDANYVYNGHFPELWIHFGNSRDEFVQAFFVPDPNVASAFLSGSKFSLTLAQLAVCPCWHDDDE